MSTHAEHTAQVRRARAVAALLTLALMLTLALAALATAPGADAADGHRLESTPTGPPPAYARPCRYEDSLRCTWDARHMGFGGGDSLIAHAGGRIEYVTHRRAHRLVTWWRNWHRTNPPAPTGDSITVVDSPDSKPFGGKEPFINKGRQSFPPVIPAAVR